MTNRKINATMFMPLSAQDPKVLVAIKQLCSAKSKKYEYLTAAALLLSVATKQAGAESRASLIVSTARTARELEHTGRAYVPEQDFWLPVYKARCALRLNELAKRNLKPAAGGNNRSR